MIKELFKKYDISLEKDEMAKFEKLLELFRERNSQINLSAIRDDEGIILKHFIDSLELNKFAKLNWKILDIWTGWGFPGVPLAITNSNCSFILVDSIGKKVDSVNHFISELGITNAKAIKTRIEEKEFVSEHKQSFDYIVSRATAYMPDILTYAKPLLKKNWKIILYKLANELELKDWEKWLTKNKMKIEKIENYEIEWQERIFVFVKNK